jgi:GT2 family glycosyltransferase
MASENSTPEYTTIQSLIWPEQGVCTERELYFRLHRPAGLSETRHLLRFAPGGQVETNTWFNLFNIGKWRHHCDLQSLFLALSGRGEFEISVLLAYPNRSFERLINETVTLSEGTPLRLDLVHGFDEDYDEGVMFFELQALGEAELTGADWQTTDAPRRIPELAISVTTFKREAEVARTIERFATHIAQSPHRDHMQMIVVDNGQSVTHPDTGRVTIIPNENLGGAGGFARGQLAAADLGASHCLFMDDDASIHMASLDRTYQFLAFAKDPATAVAGAMINAQHRWSIWENGAVFDRRCQPLFMGTDLRDPGQILHMEFATTGKPPEHFYGGWWYFAFPLAETQHMPFPFFVRGDDVSFSLVNDFNIVRLNGVVSFQESFTDKESPLTWYLDLRSHMAHHLSLPTIEIGRLGVLKIAIWFFLRNLPRMHYETLTAINFAVEDILKGPAYFDRNADMAHRRAEIKSMTQDEVWRPDTGHTLGRNRRRFNPDRRWIRTLMILSLNGHLLPFFSRFGDRLVLSSEDRANIHITLGASRITYLSTNRRKAYTVQHSKIRLLKAAGRFALHALTFLLRYNRLTRLYKDDYQDLTSQPYWRRKLGLATAERKSETG